MCIIPYYSIVQGSTCCLGLNFQAFSNTTLRPNILPPPHTGLRSCKLDFVRLYIKVLKRAVDHAFFHLLLLILNLKQRVYGGV